MSGFVLLITVLLLIGIKFEAFIEAQSLEDESFVLINRLFCLILFWYFIRLRLSIFVERNLLTLWLLTLRYLNFDETTFLLVMTFSLVLYRFFLLSNFG